MKRTTAILVSVFLAGSSPACFAKGTAQLMAGTAERNVTFSFQPSGLSIRTHLVGNPGAKLTIWIDSNRTPLFSRILTEDDCKYADEGAKCSIRIGAATNDYRQFVASFRRGATAHVEVQNANVMQMRDDVSLQGFSRQYAK